MSHLTATPRARSAPRGLRLVSACAVASLVLALAAPPAEADILSDLRDRAQNTQGRLAGAQLEIAESHEAVGAATGRLLQSQAELEAARGALADLQVQLSAARENDRQLAISLAAAREDLEAAQDRVAQAELEVDAQLRLIGGAARETFQQQTDLRELSVVFGSESPADLSQRLQWSTTIFDTQAAEKDRLDAVLAELEAARQALAELEARIAAEKEESARTVALVARLEGQAQAQAATVASLVSSNELAHAAAQAELDADEAAFRQLSSEEARLQGEIEAEIARIRAAEEAARKAVAAARSTRSVAAGAATSPGTAVSAAGFIRPVGAGPGSRFGLRFHPILKYWRSHNGVDYGAPTGTPLYAARAGTVMSSGPNGGFGNFVLLGHGDIAGRYATTGYAHLSRIVVSPGQRVSRGQLIGYVGNTGLSTTPHLHLEVRLDGVPVDPLLYIP